MNGEQAHYLSNPVLIADDDDAFRGLLTRRTEKMGIAFIEARDGDEATEILGTQKIALAIVDLSMPGKNGLEVIQAAREIDPEMMAIIITGSASLETAIEALRQGVFDYLVKPLESMTIFEMAVTRALKHHHLEQENKRLLAEVQRLAATDALTGLLNRHKFNELLLAEMRRAARYGQPLTLMILDLDKMKTINDKYGHPVGDKTLQEVSESIRASARSVDISARYGGDEFVVILPQTDVKGAVPVAKRILSTFHAAAPKETSVSAGIAAWKSSYEKMEDFLSAADQALYHAKHRGGNAISVKGMGTDSLIPIMN